MLKYNTLLFYYKSSICRQNNDINKTNANHNKKQQKSTEYRLHKLQW